ncbi:mitochondrial fission factor homolog B-like isoform X1 [Xiphophorus maculatus]|uniref:Mitochondrial fission factor n=1 Tax=Xiphophorus maculatus TaxID=8083 RepID=M3ZQ51_XIPMA|nr:mitochondrial fission factor homolog B-like isoform X1 [Xiphophorus maculatus]XP_023191599.1 mitochondrial fission factor homolog B-like isoform X1 [Xiphophorus maculatus]
MSGPSFTPPAEVAEINRIHYELEYTEGISQRMRIPETLKVAPESRSGAALLQPPLPVHTTLMQVPERIVVASDNGESRFVQPRDLDLIQSVPSVDLLNMKAPPRVLTLTEQPLDSLEMDQAANSQSNPSQTASYSTRSRRERSASENIPGRHGSHCSRGDVRFFQPSPCASVTPSPSAPPVRLCPPLCSPEDANINLYTAAGFLSYVQSTTRRAYQQVLEILDDSHRRTHLDLALDMNPDESGLVDASSLRRQIVKLNRRLQLLEEENKERSKREVALYSTTVAFWLINLWIWLRR